MNYRELLSHEYPHILTRQIEGKWEVWGMWGSETEPSPFSALLACDQPTEEAALKSAWRYHFEMEMQP